ncbi:MAG: neutral/alkaline non-lysosomal ceramidase N-terminal domain-containing protein [Chloroflexi bacterium]|nr:neutral/alkaline non-lysosomal ceramidase N-terminal domain-containing protein [Chloroflexota bacterium]
MAELLAGVGKTTVTPRVGAHLVGYFNRPEGSKGVHDDLQARALVLTSGGITVALCSVELLWLWTSIANEVRAKAARRCGIPEAQILVCCTHTHAGAAPHNPQDWDSPLTDCIADAIVQAYEARQPARVGFGFGQLFGYNINRRWLNRPADPSVGVMRVDSADGRPLAVVSNFACHAVVLGYDNYWISGDWPGYSSRLLEAELGCMALYTQGGAGDVNPLTETVRQRLAAGHPVGTIGDLTSYYGDYRKGDPATWNIEDRGGGTFLECETLARAYNAEVLRVWRAIQMTDALPMWTEQMIVNGAADPDEPRGEGLSPEYRRYVPEIHEGYIPLQIMLLGLGPAVWVTQPGEVFSETAVEFRKLAQQMGYAFPWLVSYANGSYAYLPPGNAFAEGGYEVAWAKRVGLSRHLQDRIHDAILPMLRQHAPRQPDNGA